MISYKLTFFVQEFPTPLKTKQVLLKIHVLDKQRLKFIKLKILCALLGYFIKTTIKGKKRCLDPISIFTYCPFRSAPVAQLDRASDYESGGWEFESLRARQPIFQ